MAEQSKPKFVYVTYIASTVDKVWNALIDPEITKDYWGRHRNRSDWKAGSRWTHEDYDDSTKVDIVGEVSESTPPTKLVVSWASPSDHGNPSRTSRVTYVLEPFLDMVKLTVTHDELEPDSAMLRGITGGWPMVLSSLKTLLERGQSIPSMARRWQGPPPPA